MIDSIELEPFSWAFFDATLMEYTWLNNIAQNKLTITDREHGKMEK